MSSPVLRFRKALGSPGALAQGPPLTLPLPFCAQHLCTLVPSPGILGQHLLGWVGARVLSPDAGTSPAPCTHPNNTSESQSTICPPQTAVPARAQANSAPSHCLACLQGSPPSWDMLPDAPGTCSQPLRVPLSWDTLPAPPSPPPPGHTPRLQSRTAPTRLPFRCLGS